MATPTLPLVFSITAGSLPDGLSIDTATGEISGTPDPGSAGTYTFTVHCHDSAEPTHLVGNVNKQIIVDAALVAICVTDSTEILIDGDPIASLPSFPTSTDTNRTDVQFGDEIRMRTAMKGGGYSCNDPVDGGRWQGFNHTESGTVRYGYSAFDPDYMLSSRNNFTLDGLGTTDPDNFLRADSMMFISFASASPLLNSSTQWAKSTLLFVDHILWTFFSDPPMYFDGGLFGPGVLVGGTPTGTVSNMWDGSFDFGNADAAITPGAMQGYWVAANGENRTFELRTAYDNSVLATYSSFGDDEDQAIVVEIQATINPGNVTIQVWLDGVAQTPYVDSTMTRAVISVGLPALVDSQLSTFQQTIYGGFCHAASRVTE